MNFRFYFILLLLIFPASLMAQNEHEVFDEPVVIYKKQLYGGFHFHSNGYGGTFTLGWYKGAKKVRLAGIDLLYLKHEKETKSWNPIYQDARSYIYGKTNNFYILRPGFGVKKIVTDKLRTSGVSVGYSWQIGPSLGFTKPVYLEVIYTDPRTETSYLVSEKFDPENHFSDNIFGRSSGLKGFDELKFQPGVFAKFALNFEYSNLKDRLKGLEVGCAVDAYNRRIPIMSEEILSDEGGDKAKNHQVFLTFYINLFFGKKYNNE